MACYAIGDIQGCYVSLLALLDTISFDPSRDRLWLTGDLVNRGPRSLDVLRWACSLGDRVVSVLGNHDLHLLARAAGLAPEKPLDTLDEVLRAPDRDELLGWLRRRPFLHREKGWILVHAGLAPGWSPEKAEALATWASEALDADERGFLRRYRASRSGPASRAMNDPTAAAAVVMTRVRTCHPDGSLCDFSGSPADAPPGCRPWYERRPPGEETRTIFGHWSALGLHVGPRAIGLDTGCVWGGSLTAYRLEDGAVFEQPSLELRRP